MSCNCNKVYPIPLCAELIEIGAIELVLTDVIVQFNNIITGKVKQVTTTSDVSGFVTADVTTLGTFLTPNFSYEVTILANNESQGETYPFRIDPDSDLYSLTCVYFTPISVSIDDEPIIAKFKLI